MIVGMDFGTTNSGMAVYDGHHLRVLPLDPSNQRPQVARTALYITNHKRVYMGRDAIEKYYAQNLNRPVKFERVRVGEVVLSYAELPDWVRDVYIEKDVLSPGRLFLSFKTGLSASNYQGTTVGGDFYFIEDIAALYLYIARRRAERVLGQEVRRVVLGRPVRFSFDPDLDALAQQRLLRAAFRAGYEEVYLQHEPIAAAYFYETTIDHEQNVLIFDFGGGTLDISIVRLGGRSRQILATGGIPIAGDVFDQKLVRAKLPVHFGENTTYQADDGTLRSVPNHFFEAFSSWQTILELNTPRNIEILEQIVHTASHKQRIQNLIKLVSSSYGLRVFDEVEAAKRELSGTSKALIRLDGPGFNVLEMVARAEFEHLLREERAAIEVLIDEVVRQAGLTADQIDAVIRTGGSSQIPVFIEMLQRRFGADRVQSIDTFSSVTSGLGIYAHRIASGEIDAPAYYPDAAHEMPDLDENQISLPPVDLTLVKKFVDLLENEADTGQPKVGLVALTTSHEVRAALHPVPPDGEVVPLKNVDLSGCKPASLFAAPPEADILLITTEYRFLLKTVHELADMTLAGLRLADTESLHEDQFGTEYISAMQRRSVLENAPYLLLISTSGYAKLVRTDTILSRVGQTVPLVLEHMPGYPAALVPVDESSSVLVFSSAGNVLRIDLPTTQRAGSRIVRVGQTDRVIAAISVPGNREILLADGKGRGKRIYSGALPLASQLAAGKKVMPLNSLHALAAYRPGAPLWAITTHRMFPVQLEETNGTDVSNLVLRLAKGEELAALQYLD